MKNVKMNKKNTPIILANTEWMPPKKLLEEVKSERMITSLIDMAKPNLFDYKELVGDAECLTYLMPQTMKVPLSRDWANIYLYLAGKVIKKWKQYNALPKDCKVEKLNSYEEKLLDDLKSWIYKQRGGKEKNLITNALQILQKKSFNK